MQISRQHKLIICSQYGNHCRNDSFGDVPGQVVSAFDVLIFWTIKSALVLVSGMSLLIVEKFPSAGLQMVREANGQNKSRFTPSMMGTILVMTLSHYYSACENILLRFQRPYFEWRNGRSKLHILLVLQYQFIFLQILYGDYICTWNFFLVAVVNIYFEHSWHSAVVQQNPSVQLFNSCKFSFISRLIFPDLVDIPSDLKFSAIVSSAITSNSFRNDHFPKLFEFKEHFLTFSFFLSIPTGTRTSLQVEFKSYVLVGGKGRLLQIISFFCFSKLVKIV